MQKTDLEATFLSLLESCRESLWRLAGSYDRGDEREDLYQEMVFQLWRSFSSFREQSRFKTWAYRVALNTAISYQRKKSQVNVVDAEQHEIDNALHSRGEPRDSLAILENFIRQLNHLEKAVFSLFLEGLSYQEIADITGLNENSVGIRLSRLKQTYRKRYLEE